MGANATIQLDGEVIRYGSTPNGGWTLALADVRAIGESTNRSGPLADDYFFCFVTGPETWLEASFYANGLDEFLRALGAKLGISLMPNLCNSTDFASRVLWPPVIAGRPMFKYEYAPSRGIIAKLFRLTQVRQSFSDDLAEVLV